MIEIIEKEPFRFEDTNIRPVVMIKDGKEIYIRNKVYIDSR